MVARLKRLYDSWEENYDMTFGRAFCSGADVVRLYQSLNEGEFFNPSSGYINFEQTRFMSGNTDEAEQFFKTLYSFGHILNHIVGSQSLHEKCNSSFKLSIGSQ
ncbi:3-hydroxyisobutyryl-CoA hydrolase-like protein 2, mitochondrial, partial [Mucuna pruriens]